MSCSTGSAPMWPCWFWRAVPLVGERCGRRRWRRLRPLVARIGILALRVRGPYFVILTFGLAEFAKFVVIVIEGRARQDRRPRDHRRAPASKSRYCYFWRGSPSRSTLIDGPPCAAPVSAAACGAIQSRTRRRLRPLGVPTVQFKMRRLRASRRCPGLGRQSHVAAFQAYFEPDTDFRSD